MFTHIGSIRKSMGAASGTERHGDIVSFQYYDDQPSLMHNRYDLLHYAKKDESLYQRMKDECKDFLLMYKTVLQTKDIDGFLKKVLQFLITRTFRVHKRYMNLKTNKIYSP